MDELLQLTAHLERPSASRLSNWKAPAVFSLAHFVAHPAIGAQPLEISWSPATEGKPLESNDIHVWAFRLDVSPSSQAQFAAVLSAEERERADQFHFVHHRNRFIAGRGWLRVLLGRYLRISPEQIQFAYGSQGKPALGNQPHRGLHFNLAHSDMIALAAVTWAGPLGVDVEGVRELADMDELVERFFCAREKTIFKKLSHEQKRLAFFNLWTRKEAWLKATGQGISQYLNRVEVSFVSGEKASLLSLPDGSQSAGDWSLHELNPAPGFAAALAVLSKQTRLFCWQWRENLLLPEV